MEGVTCEVGFDAAAAPGAAATATETTSDTAFPFPGAVAWDSGADTESNSKSSRPPPDSVPSSPPSLQIR